jgi:hypothetical protein
MKTIYFLYMKVCTLLLCLAFCMTGSLIAAPDESKTWTDPETARREDADY